MVAFRKVFHKVHTCNQAASGHRSSNCGAWGTEQRRKHRAGRACGGGTLPSAALCSLARAAGGTTEQRQDPSQPERALWERDSSPRGNARAVRRLGRGGSAGRGVGGAGPRARGTQGRRAGADTTSLGAGAGARLVPGQVPGCLRGAGRGPRALPARPAGRCAASTAHLVALGGLLQRRRAVAPVLGTRVARPAQRRLVLLAEEAELLAVPRALRARGARGRAQLPQAVHQAGQLPVGAEALPPEGAAALRAGEEAALLAGRPVAELGDAAQAEAVAAVHADRVLQQVQAHGAPRLLPQALLRRPRGHAGRPAQAVPPPSCPRSAGPAPAASTLSLRPACGAGAARALSAGLRSGAPGSPSL